MTFIQQNTDWIIRGQTYLVLKWLTSVFKKKKKFKRRDSPFQAITDPIPYLVQALDNYLELNLPGTPQHVLSRASTIYSIYLNSASTCSVSLSYVTLQDSWAEFVRGLSSESGTKHFFKDFYQNRANI